MGRHSVVEAKNNLSDLIARAEGGEEVVITRHGVPVVEIKAVKPAVAAKGPMTQTEVDWLASRRITLKPGAPDAVTLVRQMRDEGY